MIETQSQVLKDGHVSGGERDKREGSATVADVDVHPQIMLRWLNTYSARLKARLIDDQRAGLAAIDKAIDSLRAFGQEPFPGFIENMIAEFEGARRELENLDPDLPGDPERFFAIASGLDLLSANLSLLMERQAASAPLSTPSTTSSCVDSNP